MVANALPQTDESAVSQYQGGRREPERREAHQSRFTMAHCTTSLADRYTLISRSCSNVSVSVACRFTTACAAEAKLELLPSEAAPCRLARETERVTLPLAQLTHRCHSGNTRVKLY